MKTEADCKTTVLPNQHGHWEIRTELGESHVMLSVTTEPGPDIVKAYRDIQVSKLLEWTNK